MISQYHFRHQRLQTEWVRPCGTACSIAVRRFFKESGSWFAVSVVLTAIIPHPMSCVIYCIFLLGKDWALVGKFNRHLFLSNLLKNGQHTAQREWCKSLWYDVIHHNLESFTYRYSGTEVSGHPLDAKKVSGHLREYKDTEFVLELTKTGFCEGSLKYNRAVQSAYESVH